MSRAGTPAGGTDQGSTLPLILGFFLVAMLIIGGAVALGQVFVQQRELQDICDGAATAAAASSGDLDRGAGAAQGDSLRFTGVAEVVDAYLRRSPDRTRVQVAVTISADAQRITLTCRQDRRVPLGALVGQGTAHHVVTSSARAAVLP